MESELGPSMLCIHLARNGATPREQKRKEKKRTELEVDHRIYLMKEHTHSYKK